LRGIVVRPSSSTYESGRRVLRPRIIEYRPTAASSITPHVGRGGEMDRPGGKVVDNAAERRFELEVEGQLATLDYERDGDRLVLLHTEVPLELEGKGYGSAVVQGALEHARSARLRIVPSCPFVREFVHKNPEYELLVIWR